MSIITPRRALIGAATAGIVLASQPSLIASPALILPPAVAEQMERRGIVEPHRRMPDIENVMAMLMMAKMSGMLSGGGAAAGLSVSDVFATSLYTGNGASRTIATGLNMSVEGGLTWIKTRSGTESHVLFDTVRGAGNSLTSNGTELSDSTPNRLTAFGAAGFDLGNDPISAQVNGAGRTYVAWSFRRAPKFFDVVTYTGNGSGSRALNHGLTISPGMVIIKRTDSTSDWFVYHAGIGADTLRLNTTGAKIGTGAAMTVSSTQFTIVGGGGDFNDNGSNYVAYLFAHDTAVDGLVQCGLATGTTAVNLGWKPQFLILKTTTVSNDWVMIDAARGIDVPAVGNDYFLAANSSAAEVTSTNYAAVTSTGFSRFSGNPDPYAYLAIRAP